MKSRAASSFWNRYDKLPPEIQKLAVKQYHLWLTDHSHPSVRFKKVGRFWSARVTDDFRALGVVDSDTVVWFWVGLHSEYRKILRR